MEERQVEGKLRRICRDCKRVRYPDVIVAVSAIVHDSDGRILFVKRAIEPGFGKWVIPGGYAERGESLQEAAVRETVEEVAVSLGHPALSGVYGSEDSGVATVVFTMTAHAPSQRQAGSETLRSRFFGINDIPWSEVYFASTRQALEDWIRNWWPTKSGLTKHSYPE